MAPEAVSTKLSTPKPSSAMLPEASAAATATRPSTMFQLTVPYSSRSACWTRVGRVAVFPVLNWLSDPADNQDGPATLYQVDSSCATDSALKTPIGLVIFIN